MQVAHGTTRNAGTQHTGGRTTLLLCDWLPNEERIQIRGPTYEFLHKSVYGEAAKQAGKYLSYKIWMECKAEGLVLVAALLKGSDPKRLRASRSARHSKCFTPLMCHATNVQYEEQITDTCAVQSV